MSEKIELTVDEFSQGQRLDVFCATNLPELTRSHLQRLIAQGSVTLNGKPAKASKEVTEEDVVIVCPPEPVPLCIPAEPIPLDIVYEDADLLVVNKQQGLTVHPANGVYSGTLVNALLFRVKDLSGINGVLRPGIVHRLDKNTSGLMLVAKNDLAHRSLAEQIAIKQCKRVYWALLEGILKSDAGTVDAPIARSPSDRKKMAVVEGGKQAVSLYRVLKRYAEYTLCEFELKTGRTHQIRVHARYLGHPVVGDDVYGYQKQKFKLNGQLLHSKRISFRQPTTGELLSFEAPLPDYFEKVLKSLR